MRIYEFLYRGAVPSEGRLEPAWHIVLADDVVAFGKTEAVMKGPMTPERAKEDFQVDISTVVQEINAEAMASRDRAFADAANLREQLAQEKKKSAELSSMCEALNDKLLVAVSEIIAMQKQIDIGRQQDDAS